MSAMGRKRRYTCCQSLLCRCDTDRFRTLRPNSARATFGTCLGARSVDRRIKDIFEISEYTSLDALIERLQTIRAYLDEGASPLVAMRGDDFFGQRLTITYLRELTQDEAAMEERYSAAGDRKRSSGSRRIAIRPGRRACQLRRTLG